MKQLVFDPLTTDMMPDVLQQVNALDFSQRGYYHTSTYGPDAKPPKITGEWAIETTHTTKASLLAELYASAARPDIGKVFIGCL